MSSSFNTFIRNIFIFYIFFKFHNSQQKIYQKKNLAVSIVVFCEVFKIAKSKNLLRNIILYELLEYYTKENYRSKINNAVNLTR